MFQDGDFVVFLVFLPAKNEIDFERLCEKGIRMVIILLLPAAAAPSPNVVTPPSFSSRASGRARKGGSQQATLLFCSHPA